MRRVRPTSAGLTRWIAARKRASLGPIPAAESRSSRSRSAASAATSSAVTASMRSMISSSESSSVSVISDFPSRLIRFEVDSIESSIRPFRFSFARSSSPGRTLPADDVAELARDDLEALDEVLLARADVEPDLAGVRVLRGEAVDRVGHPPLLADLLEEP